MEIKKFPDSVLTQKAEVFTWTPENMAWLDEFTTFFHAQEKEPEWGNMAGLAAPQVGKSLRVFGAQGKIYINPEIVWKTKAPANTFVEGCYSLAQESLYKVERAPSIRLRWQSTNQEWHEERFNGFAAQVIAHEMDHLEGRLCAPEEELAKIDSVYQQLTGEKKKL